MGDEDARKLPLNLITQVQRDELDYAGGISARRTSNGGGSDKKSIFSKIFCCFGGGDKDSGTASRKASTQQNDYLLPPIRKEHEGKKCLVLDLDETLVHSSFKPVSNADFIIPIEIEDHVHQVYVLKRPHVDHFMKTVGEMFEVAIFTASLNKYGDPVIDLLDKHKVVHHRLFREHCTQHRGNYVKDMARIGRPLKDIIIIDNSPASYLFNPENAIPIETWFDDENDTELLDLIPFLCECAKADDVMVPLQEQFGSP